MDREPVGYLLKQITDKIKASADAPLKSKALYRIFENVSENIHCTSSGFQSSSDDFGRGDFFH